MLPRVLVVVPRLDVGGAEMHLARVLPELRHNGLDVLPFVLTRGGSLEKALTDRGVQVLGAQASGSRLARSIRAGWALRRELRRLRPDIVHFFLPEAYLIGSLATIGFRPAFRIMSRRSLADYQRNHPILGWFERRLHRSTTTLLGNSMAVVRQLIEESGQPDKVGLIHNGIDIPPGRPPGHRAAIRCDLGIAGETFVIAVVANLISYKGHQDLFEALALVGSRISKPWRLLLIGRDEGIGGRLRQQASSLGIAQNIVWLGEVADARSLLDAADIAILPSHQEGFSNSLLEKMACGLAVIATGVGGNLDAIVDGESGLLVPAMDARALGDAVIKLYEDAELRGRLGRAARRRTEQLFSLDACVGRYLNLYGGVRDIGSTPVMQLIEPRVPGQRRQM